VFCGETIAPIRYVAPDNVIEDDDDDEMHRYHAPAQAIDR
jgi:hypothetical protein